MARRWIDGVGGLMDRWIDRHGSSATLIYFGVQSFLRETIIYLHTKIYCSKLKSLRLPKLALLQIYFGVQSLLRETIFCLHTKINYREHLGASGRPPVQSAPQKAPRPPLKSPLGGLLFKVRFIGKMIIKSVFI